ERLDAEAVAGEEEPAPAGVPERKGEHSVDGGEQALAFFFIEMDDHLGVGAGAKAMAPRLQPRAQGLEAEELAVVREPDRAVLVRHRLAARGAEVEDGEPAVGEAETAVAVEALVVGPAVGEGARHCP